MSYTNGLDKPSDYFNTKLYTGTGSSGEKAITGVGFQPDWLWIKNRTVAQEHWLADSVRGTTKFLESNSSNAESSDGATGLASFDSDGFTLGTGSDRTNDLNESMVAWCWLAAGTASSNTDGSITSSVSANTTAGFSIVSWTGTGANATIGHGLGAEPKMIFLKIRTGTNNWQVYNKSIGSGNALFLNTTDASSSNTGWQSTDATSSVFYVSGGTAVNGSGASLIAYCFAEKKGYSKFGSYTGNGSSDGSFIHTGMKPSFVIFKRNDDTSRRRMYDNKINQFNVADTRLSAESSDAENTNSLNAIDMISQGFKIRTSESQLNASGGTFIYMAFSENPFVTSTGIPTTARYSCNYQNILNYQNLKNHKQLLVRV